MGTVPAGGKVTLDGEPVEGASVAFSPQSDGGKAAVGMTDASGAFSLMTDGSDEGAMPGSYKVSVTKTSGGGGGAELSYDQMTPEQLEEAGKRAQGMMSGQGSDEVKELLPEKYKTADTSGLSVEVPGGGDQNIVLELTSE